MRLPSMCAGVAMPALLRVTSLLSCSLVTKVASTAKSRRSKPLNMIGRSDAVASSACPSSSRRMQR
jgi:hypothetical protein